MASRPFAPASPRGVRFARMALLALALLLALAQGLAIRHAYSHAPGEATTQSGGKHPGGLAHCEACVVAAAIGGAAPPATPLLFAAAAAQQPQPQASTGQAPAPQQRPYAIRAPPASAS